MKSLNNIREEYLNKSIVHCNKVIEEFEKELLNEDNEFVREQIKEIINLWECSKKDYLFFNEVN